MLRCLAILALLLLGASSARAGEPFPGYYGSFVGMRVEGGASLSGLGGATRSTGGSLVVGPRLSSILQLLDLGLSYRHHRAPLESATLVQHAAELEMRLHPLAIVHIRSSKPWIVVAGFHAVVGAGLTHSSAEAGAKGYGFAYAAGLGLDVPLTSLKNLWGVWLGLVWRARLQGSEISGLGRDLSHHSLGLALELRHHSLDY
jgi:hypothetical protein